MSVIEIIVLEWGLDLIFNVAYCLYAYRLTRDSVINSFFLNFYFWYSKHPSGLSVFFKEKQFIASHRSELYGPTELVANCGGLMGLFMGMSILSIVEMLYFCSLRLMCSLKWQRKCRYQAEVRKEQTTDGRNRTSVCGDTIGDEKPQDAAYLE